MAKRWVACISQTGRELYEICESLMRKPDVLILTDESKVIPELLALEIEQVIAFAGRPTIDLLYEAFSGADVITLHGFLYILPKPLCELFAGKIFNGHPGLITKYAQLKGKDPQVRAYGNYPSYGCVLHEVVAEVDAGQIISSDEIYDELVKDLDDLFIVLKQMSINLWLSFFQKAFAEEGVRYQNSALRQPRDWQVYTFEGTDESTYLIPVGYTTRDNEDAGS